MNITTENINTLAQLASSISDGDYIYIYKAESNSFARIEKSLLLGSGGGGSTSAATISNVNLLRAKIDELIEKLANSAFANSRPSEIGELDWGTGGETVYYYISGINSSSMMYSVSNTDTMVLAGSAYTNVITAKAGYNLTGVTVNGVSQTILNNSCTITVTNIQFNIIISVSAQSQHDSGTTYTIIPNLTELQLSPNGGIVVQGSTFTCTLSLSNGVSNKRLPDSIAVNGAYGSLSYNSRTGAIEITNIQSDITIAASAISTSDVTTYTQAECTIENEYVRWYSGIIINNDHSQNQSRSDYIPIVAGKTVKVTPNYTANEAGLAFFTSEKTYCGSSSNRTGVKYEGSEVVVTAPENAAYFMFSCKDNQTVTVEIY